MLVKKEDRVLANIEKNPEDDIISIWAFSKNENFEEFDLVV